MIKLPEQFPNASATAVPSPLRGEGRRERSERGVRGRARGRASDASSSNHAPASHPRPLSPKGRGENSGDGLRRFARFLLILVLIISADPTRAAEPLSKKGLQVQMT